MPTIYNQPKPLSFRCAYHHRIGPPAGETPPEAVEGAVLAIVEAWNTLIPSRKVRLLNDVRFDMVRAALRQFSQADIIQAITFYSKQAWQKKNAKWQLFDNFFFAAPPRNPPLINWWEAAMTAAEKAEEKRPPAKAVRELTAGIGKAAKSVQDGWTRRKQAFFTLSAREQEAVRALAALALQKHRPKAVITKEDIQKYAIATMKI